MATTSNYTISYTTNAPLSTSSITSASASTTLAASSNSVYYGNGVQFYYDDYNELLSQNKPKKAFKNKIDEAVDKAINELRGL